MMTKQSSQDTKSKQNTKYKQNTESEQNTEFTLQDLFHSGKRLDQARKLKGFNLDSLAYEPLFPVSSERTISRWKKKGITSKYVKEVAKFFDIDLWAFTHEHLSQEDFREIVVNPDCLEMMKEKYVKQSSSSEKNSRPIKSKSTHILTFKSQIKQQLVNNFELEDLQDSLLSRLPINTEPFSIDCNEIADQGTPAYWKKTTQKIKEEWEKWEEIEKQMQQRDCRHLSLFALAPIPLLMFLGKLIGDRRKVDLFQYHRDTASWRWKPEVESSIQQKAATSGEQGNYLISEPKANQYSLSDVSLSLEISTEVKPQAVKEVLFQQGVESFAEYKLKIPKTSLYFLQSYSQLIEFRRAYSQILTDIWNQHPPRTRIHLFSAIPAPFAIECGRGLSINASLPLQVYDFRNQQFVFAFEL